MPFMGRDAAQPLRKRRRQDEDTSLFSLYPSSNNEADVYSISQSHYSNARKVLPLSKRSRLSDGHHATHAEFQPGHKRRVSQQRLASHDATETLNTTTPEKPRTMNLTPCHVCHRRPTKKSDLDSYAECQQCLHRTCFVCIRECRGLAVDDDTYIMHEQEALSRSFQMDDADNGEQSPRQQHNPQDGRITTQLIKAWNGSMHCSVVCSQCSIEKGTEGEVLCIACLSRGTNAWRNPSAQGTIFFKDIMSSHDFTNNLLARICTGGFTFNETPNSSLIFIHGGDLMLCYGALFI